MVDYICKMRFRYIPKLISPKKNYAPVFVCKNCAIFCRKINGLAVICWWKWFRGDCGTKNVKIGVENRGVFDT